MDHVTLATMEIYQELLGLKFKKIEGAQNWHEDVQLYQTEDKKTGKVLGQFYLDFYTRDLKKGHAMVSYIFDRAKINGTLHLPVVSMITNFPKPTAEKPSLLSHEDVITFFHEFGHIMHHMCSEANYTRFSGTSVERDFVELPSQMLENWMWDKDIVQRVSKHYKTGEKLPEEMLT